MSGKKYKDKYKTKKEWPGGSLSQFTAKFEYEEKTYCMNLDAWDWDHAERMVADDVEIVGKVVYTEDEYKEFKAEGVKAVKTLHLEDGSTLAYEANTGAVISHKVAKQHNDNIFGFQG